MHVIAGKAVCFKEALTPEFRAYQHQIVRNAARLAAGLSAAGFRLVSGGTDNHLMLVDVFSRGITGKVAEAALGRAAITVNKNTIPFDQHPPLTASGIRVGTPAVTTRGMREPEMDAIAGFIGRVLAAPDDESVAARVRADVEDLCRQFPLYPELGQKRAPEPSASISRSPKTVRSPRRSTGSNRGRASAGWPRKSRACSPPAARSSPKRAPAPERPWRIWSPRCSPAGGC